MAAGDSKKDQQQSVFDDKSARRELMVGGDLSWHSIQGISNCRDLGKIVGNYKMQELNDLKNWIINLYTLFICLRIVFA